MKNRINSFSQKMITGIIISVISIVQVFAQSNFPSKYPDRIVLNLTENPATSMAVTWRTDTTINTSYCQLQPAADTRINPEESQTFKAKTITVEYSVEQEPVVIANQHSYIITGLKPGVKYIYRVGANENWSEWFQFQTPSTENDNFSFIYFGDLQLNIKSQCSRVIREAYRQDPNCGFMLYAGDLINSGTDTEWHEWFDAGSYLYSTIPQVMTPGNHEYEDLEVGSHWKYQFTQPANGPAGLDGSCFFTDYKNLRLISIDTAADSELKNESGVAVTSQQLWLDSILTNNPKKWTILTTHLPFYSQKESHDNKYIRKYFQPIIEKHGVDMVLTGHDHSYGRGTKSDNPDIKPSIVYVVSVSGPKLHSAGDKDWMQKSISHTILYQVISINDDVLTYEVFSVSGKLLDKLVLMK